LVLVTPTNTPIPTVLVTQVAAVVVTPTQVAQVAGAISPPRTGGGPPASSNQGMVLAGMFLILSGGALFLISRRANAAS